MLKRWRRFSSIVMSEMVTLFFIGLSLTGVVWTVKMILKLLEVI